VVFHHGLRFDRKVALEEHVVLPPLAAPGSVGAPIFHAARAADIQQRLGDVDKPPHTVCA
jgi:hypothetical protein